MNSPDRPSLLNVPLRPRRPEDFEALYAGTPPWDIGRPQLAFLRLTQAGALQGRVLDIGCGTGEHALMAAGLGLAATGLDFAAAAIETAQGKARDRGLNARFLVGSALELAALQEQFDTVLDCGLFHIFEDEDRPLYVDSLRAAIRAGGHLYLLCASDRLPGDLGPRRVSKDELMSSFGNGWRVDAIEAAEIEVNMLPTGLPAWLASITRI